MTDSIHARTVAVRADAIKFFFFVAVLVGANVCHAEMEIRGILDGTAPTSNYDRFANSPAWIGNPSNWSGGAAYGTSPVPWSGVGRDITNGTWATLISSSFIISADHWHPAIGDTIAFYLTNNPNSTPVTRTVVAGEGLQESIAGDSGDVWVGKLSATATGMASYPILKLPTVAGDNSAYGGLGIDTFGLSGSGFTTGTSSRLGRNIITPGSVTSGVNSYNFSIDAQGVGVDASQVMAGDSGAPSFFLYAGGTPALLGQHWYNNAPLDSVSGDTWLTNYASDIQTGMNQLGNSSGETVKTISPVLGDFNLDGHRTAADFTAMEVALTNLPNYESTHGMNDAYLNMIGDLNGDGKINNADLQKLSSILISGGGTSEAVPEPAGWLLAIIGLLSVWPGARVCFTPRRTLVYAAKKGC